MALEKREQWGRGIHPQPQCHRVLRAVRLLAFGHHSSASSAVHANNLIHVETYNGGIEDNMYKSRCVVSLLRMRVATQNLFQVSIEQGLQQTGADSLFPSVATLAAFVQLCLTVC